MSDLLNFRKNNGKITLIFEIKYISTEEESVRFCKGCKKLNLKKAIVIKHCKIESRDTMYTMCGEALRIRFNGFMNDEEAYTQRTDKNPYFCSKGCAKLYFERKTRITTGKWIEE